MALILIVDDDVQIRKYLTRLLAREGNEVLVAANGNEAVTTYQKRNPDLVITDIVMPEKEGLETIAEMKRLDPDANIIAISGGGKVSPDSYLSWAKKIGAKATLQKPLDKDELFETIHTALSE